MSNPDPVEALRTSARSLVDELNARHLGRMPEAVKAAIDAVDAALSSLQPPREVEPMNLRLFRDDDGTFYLRGLDGSGHGDTPEAAMRDLVRHRNCGAADTWPVSSLRGAETPPDDAMWVMEQCHVCGHKLRFPASHCPQCGAKAAAGRGAAEPEQPTCQRPDGCNTSVACKGLPRCGDELQFGKRELRGQPPASREAGTVPAPPIGDPKP